MDPQYSPAAPALELEGFGVAFGRRVVLASVDIRLPTAGVDVLMGPVHAGKSTLMRSLAGLNRQNALFRSWGRARVRGRDVDDEWRPSLVQQHARLLAGTVHEALIHHARQKEERSQSAWQAWSAAACERYGLAARIQGGLDAPMLAQPSVVQRQVNILSYALARPPLLLVDEPTYGLDERAAMLLIDWLVLVGLECRLLVALHHQGQARKLGQRVMFLAGGRVLGADNNPRFFTHPANEAVDQFVRTGSCFVPSPDARIEDLDENSPVPPPLPAGALAAVRAAEAEELRVAAARVSVSGVATAASPSPDRSATAAWAANMSVGALRSDMAAFTTGHVEVVESPSPAGIETHGEKPEPRLDDNARASIPGARSTNLPPTSRNGVEAASMVGLVVMSSARAPTGFYWINPGHLAGCAEPGVLHDIDYDLDLLKMVGITYLITLTERDLNQDALERAGLKNLHLPIYDREAPSMSQAYMLVRRMQLLLERGETIAVHCKAGIGRTGTMLACWLIREGGLSADVAIGRLRAINKAYVQTAVQEEFLAAFEQDILKRL